MFVSVVIPAYNAEQHLRRCLDAVCEQTHDSFEAIVVNDGSTDNTAEIVKYYSDPRVRLVQQPNGGVSVARNRGIEEAKSEWIAFLDADDEWKPTFLETVTSVACQFPEASAVFTNLEDYVTKRVWVRDSESKPHILDCYFTFVHQYKQGMSSSSSLIRRDELLDIGGFPVEVTHGEDIDTWMRLAWRGPIVYVPQPLAVYHTETEGSAMKLPLAKRLCYPQAARTFRNWNERGLIPKESLAPSRRYVERELLRYVAGLLAVGNSIKARRILFKECHIGANPMLYSKYVLGAFVPSRIYQYLRELRTSD